MRIARGRPNRQLTTAAPPVGATQAAPGMALGQRTGPAAAFRIPDSGLDVLFGMPPPRHVSSIGGPLANVNKNPAIAKQNLCGPPTCWPTCRRTVGLQLIGGSHLANRDNRMRTPV